MKPPKCSKINRRAYDGKLTLKIKKKTTNEKHPCLLFIIYKAF